MSDLKEMIAKRRKRIDDESGFGDKPESKGKNKPVEDADKETYEADFDKEAKLKELKERKKELLKGVSDKNPAERKKLQEQLRELNDKIMDLEN